MGFLWPQTFLEPGLLSRLPRSNQQCLAYLYSFSTAAETNGFKLSGLNNTDLSYSSGDPKSKVDLTGLKSRFRQVFIPAVGSRKDLTGLKSRFWWIFNPAGGSRKEPDSCLSQVLEAVGIPPLVAPFLYLQSQGWMLFMSHHPNSPSSTFKDLHGYIGPTR